MENLKTNLTNNVEKVNNEFESATPAEVKKSFLPVSKYTIYNEEWKPLADINPRYFVSNYGRIIDVALGRKLYPVTNDCGYYRVTLTHIDGQQHHYFVHRLVALSFCEGYHPTFDVDHIDEDKTNNYYENLRWVTKKYNRGTRNTGRCRKPRAHKIPCIAIPVDPALVNLESREIYFESYSACALHFDVDRTAVENAAKTQEYFIKGYQIIDNYKASK